MTFKDYFSGHADRYEAYRPTYPAVLFEYLASQAPSHDLAWDCATGNGQAAHALAPFFRRVVATDASTEQIGQARPHESVTYLVSRAERTPLPDDSVDLVTVALALHWFDPEAFYAEVRRIVRPGGVLACWTYHLHTVGPEVDAVVHRLYHDILGPSWPPEIRHIEAGYRTLPFPFEEIQSPRFLMTRRMDLHRLMGYLGTWSAAQRHRTQTGADPIDAIRSDLNAAWGDPDQEREVVWPLHVRVGRIKPGG